MPCQNNALSKSSGNIVDRPQGMRPSEIEVLCELIKSNKPKYVLEIGMANGSSTVAMLDVLNKIGSGRLVSIDPFQYSAPGSIGNDNNDGYAGQGVENVKTAGYSHMHELIDEPNFLALPKLIEKGVRFDFIFIDGYHSFDYTLLDFFFSDLLLRDGGVLAMHDTSAPAVYKVCRFISENKPYSLLGPKPEILHSNIVPKILRRVGYLISGNNDEFTQRRTRWCSLAAFRKESTAQCRQFEVNGL